MAMPQLVTVGARSGAIEAVDVLLEYHGRPEPSAHGDDVPRPFFTPLNAACQAAQVAVVRHLLDPNPLWDIEERDDENDSSLLSALQAEEVISLLLARGADAAVVIEELDSARPVQTALTIAIPSASLCVINQLVKAGAS
jgi:hypothetical protein